MKMHASIFAAFLLAACGNEAQSPANSEDGSAPAESEAERSPAPTEGAEEEPNAGPEEAQPSSAESEIAPAPTPDELAEIGRRAFGECGVCHMVREGQRSFVGPNLFGIYGKTAGTEDGFAYSAAMRDSGVVWNDETLDAFLKNPQGFMRGNRMSYQGLPNDQRRAAVIAYLKTLTSE